MEKANPIHAGDEDSALTQTAEAAPAAFTVLVGIALWLAFLALDVWLRS